MLRAEEEEESGHYFRVTLKSKITFCISTIGYVLYKLVPWTGSLDQLPARTHVLSFYLVI